MRTPFFGPFSVSRSTNVADNNLINLYPELVEGRNGKEVGALYLTPGLVLQAMIGNGPIYGAHVMGGVLYVVSGVNLYSLNAAFSPVLIGSVGATDLVTMLDNGFQLGIFAGSSLWVYTPGSGTLIKVVLPFAPSGSAVELDGFVVAAQTASPLIQGTILWQSNLLDMTAWLPTTFASATGNAEPIVTLAEINREIFVFKQTVTEVWVNAGTSPFAFARLDGAYIESGAAAQRCVAQIGDSLVFVSQNFQGAGPVLQMRGYNPEVVSTVGIEAILQGYPTLSDLSAYAYQQDNHHFYVLNSSSGDATWAFDATASRIAKQPMWHRRASFSGGQLHRHPGQVYVYYNGMNLIGDSQNGNLYQYAPLLATDNGAPRKWLRSWRATAQPSEQPIRFSSLRIDMQTGIGVTASDNPQLVLRWSDDGGHTWSNERYAAAGKIGETARRVKFNRLGSTRRNSGLDRIFELSSTDAFPAALIGAELE